MEVFVCQAVQGPLWQFFTSLIVMKMNRHNPAKLLFFGYPSKHSELCQEWNERQESYHNVDTCAVIWVEVIGSEWLGRWLCCRHRRTLYCSVGQMRSPARVRARGA